MLRVFCAVRSVFPDATDETRGGGVWGQQCNGRNRQVVLWFCCQLVVPAFFHVTSKGRLLPDARSRHLLNGRTVCAWLTSALVELSHWLCRGTMDEVYVSRYFLLLRVPVCGCVAISRVASGMGRRRGFPSYVCIDMGGLGRTAESLWYDHSRLHS